METYSHLADDYHSATAKNVCFEAAAARRRLFLELAARDGEGGEGEN